MAKVSQQPSNDYCPQTLFLYGTFREDGKPNFGLFCWFSYYWNDGLGVMAAIGGSKLTLDRIRETKVFSANLVTEKILPLADYFGTADGYLPQKMDVPIAWEKGAALNVPILTDSPFAFELEVVEFLPRDDSEILLCKVRNVLVDAALDDPSVPVEQKMRLIAPVSSTQETYFGWDGRALGAWHEPAKQIRANGGDRKTPYIV